MVNYTGYFPEGPWSTYPRTDYDWSIGGRPGMKDWDQFKEMARRYTLKSADYPELRDRAASYSQLYYNPAYRELERRSREAGRQYAWNQGKVGPEYQRLVAEQQHGLGQQLSAYQMSREQSQNDYGRSLQNLMDQSQQARRRTELDMARRGLWQSGVLNRAYSGLDKTYGQQLGDIERQSTSRLSDLTRLGALAQEKAEFNISDAQRARQAALDKIREAYQGTLDEGALRRQQLAEEQGPRAAGQYDIYLDQLRDFALKARGQEFGERAQWHNMYWKEQEFIENARRWGLEFAQKMRAYQDALDRQNNYGGGGGGGGGGYSGGSSGYGSGGGNETPDYMQAMWDSLASAGLLNPETGEFQTGWFGKAGTGNIYDYL